MRLEKRHKVPGTVDILYYDTPERVIGWAARLSQAEDVVEVWPPQVNERGEVFATARRRLPHAPAVRPTPRPVPQWGQRRWRLELRPEHVLPLVVLGAGLAGVGVVVWLAVTAVSGAVRWTAANGELVVGVLTVAGVGAVVGWLAHRRPAKVSGGFGGGHACSGHHCRDCRSR